MHLIPVGSSRGLRNLLPLNFGQKGKDDFGVFNLFPSSFELYDAGEQALRDIGLGFRAKYVSAAAELAVQKKINVNELINKSCLLYTSPSPRD